MCLTVNEIREDITGFEDRIHSARLSLHYLPKGRRLSSKEQQLYRKYKAEIAHCEQLIEYAREGIEIRQKEAGTKPSLISSAILEI